MFIFLALLVHDQMTNDREPQTLGDDQPLNGEHQLTPMRKYNKNQYDNNIKIIMCTSCILGTPQTRPATRGAAPTGAASNGAASTGAGPGTLRNNVSLFQVL